QARGGVLTGSAAVELGNEAEGMVLGDTVNTASRLQSLAAPGEVLVDDVTRRGSEAAITYEDAGEHAVRGREWSVRAWRALRVVPGRADLFSGWRLFLERLADQRPVVLVFEDLQWADSGLLDFIEYLLEWSSGFPIFILALGRPELSETRSGWPSLALEPLENEAMLEVLGGLVPGLPDELVDQIVERAEGVPLYAVETVRMLLDRGVLAQEGARYVLSGEMGELAIPETLQALLTARLDGLVPAERAPVQDASVLGQSFTAAGLAALGE